MQRLLSLCLALLAIPSCLTADDGASSLPEQALRVARGVRATKMGVDAGGDLWTWDFGTGRVSLFSPAGEAVTSAIVKDVVGLDVDGRWGIAAIVAQGKELRLVPLSAGAPVSVELPNESRGVAWIDSDTIAVAPALSDHRAEVWSIREKRLLKALGTADVVVPTVGATVLRTVDLHYDKGRGLLYSLETFHGDLQVFALDGRLVRHEILPSVERPQLNDWLAEADRENRERHEVFTPGIFWFSLAVDAAGTAWSVLSCDRAKSRALLSAIPVLGKSRTVAVETPCCSLAVAIWKDQLVTYAGPTDSRETCNLVWRAQ